MSFVANRRMRLHALSFATAIAVSAIAAPAMAGKVDLSGLGSGQTYDRFIVGYRSGTPEQKNIAIAKETLARASAAQVGGKAIALNHLRRMGIGSDVVRVDRKLDKAEAESLMRQIAADPDVEYVQVDSRVQAFMTPNDPYYQSYQWDMHGTYGIRADHAWDAANGAGVVVAVIDTGITDHPDLNANVLPGYDFIDDAFIANDGNGRDGDASDPGDGYAAGQCGAGSTLKNSSWHGTHVAGTVAAVTNNALGVAGVAHGAKLVPVRVLGRCGGNISDVLDAMVWASGGIVPGAPINTNPAEVINMSLGAPGSCNQAVQTTIYGVLGRGTTIVVAAGNDNASASGYFPGNCNGVISVASTTKTGARSDFSNFGNKIDVAAPGSGIISTLNAGLTSPAAPTYGKKDGTSMSSPHVAGVVALMQSVAPSPLTPMQVEAVIKATATPFSTAPSQLIGTGIVNAQAAVDGVLNNILPTVPLPASVSSQTPVAFQGATAAVSPIVAPGPGNASTNTEIFVSISHPATNTLQLKLISPDGSVYTLPNPYSSFSTGQPIVLNLLGEQRAGTWKLQVTGPANSAPGTLASWGMTFN